MKKYMPVFLFGALIVTSLGFNAKPAIAANCASGDIFNTATGQACSSSSSVVACPIGNVFSSVTGQRCTTFIISSRSLTIGSEGEDVKSIQKILKNKGYSLGIVDGSYGQKTSKAVKAFQNDSGLLETGNVDSTTLKILDPFGVVVPNPNNPSLPHSPPSTPASATSNMKLLVLLVKFQNTTTEPYSKSYMQGQVFTNSDSVKQFYEKNSYNRMSVTGDVFGWYTIPDMADGTCNNNKKKWMDDAQLVAQQNGVNLSQYTHIVFVFPDQDRISSGCNFPGEAYPFDVFPRALVFSSEVSLIVHELGHTLGLGHADSLDCGQDSIKANYHSTCTFINYGDPFDFMGTGEENGQRLFSFSAIHRIGLGWFLPSNTQSITTNGTYVIHALETPSIAVQVLKIKKPDSEMSYPTSQNDYYYIDYNPDVDYAVGKSVDGVFVRVWNQDRGFGTLLLDMTPKSCVPNPFNPSGCPLHLHSDLDDGMLKDGMTFVDNNGIRITQISHTSTEATVTVTFPQSTTPTPVVSLTSEGIETKPDNYTVDYRVTFDGSKFNPAGLTLELSCSPESVSWTYSAGIGKPDNTCTNRSDNNTGIDMQKFSDDEYRATVVFFNASSQNQSVVARAKAWGGTNGKNLLTSDGDTITLPPSGWGLTHPVITVLSPNGGENITKGQYSTIQWSSQNLPTNASLNIFVVNDNDLHFQIASGLNPNEGSFNKQLFVWKSSGTALNGESIPAGKYKVDLEVQYPVPVTDDNHKGSALVMDLSDNYFTITSSGNVVQY
ncbi:MAG: peptidoglycan-binding protein [bacterium]